MEGRTIRRIGLTAVAAVIVLTVSWAFAQSPAPAAPGALVNQYCIFCHSQKLKTAGVVLEGVDFSHPGANADVLEEGAAQASNR